MIRISAITRVGLVVVACAAVAAPSALAKPPVKSLYGYAMSYTPTKAAKVQSVKKAASSSNDNLRTDLSNAYTRGCQNGTVSDRTMGGDNNNYEYYGDICTVSVPVDPAPSVLGASGQTVTPAAGPAISESEFYGGWDYE